MDWTWDEEGDTDIRLLFNRMHLGAVALYFGGCFFVFCFFRLLIKSVYISQKVRERKSS